MTKGNGFTLVELLVAMVAGTMLLGSLSWTLATLGRELRASTRAGAGHHLDAAAPMLAGLIEQIVPAPSGRKAVLAGPGSLAMITVPPAALGAIGPVRATLSVRPYQGGAALYVGFAPVDASAPLPAAARAERRLVDGYRRIDFRYALPAAREAHLPPKLVTIGFTDPQGRTVTLAAAPRLNSGGSCRFDPVSMTCRR
jgi:prepilin-type N-terminal cleavage/methylation domain-containing protein